MISLCREMVKPEARTVDLAFSSEEPVVRYWGIEVLDHSPGSMREGRAKQGIALLFNHDRDLLLGVMEGCRCDSDKMGRGTARFSRSAAAEEKWQDVSDGILKDVSVGYEVHFAEEVDPKNMPKNLMEMAAREKLPVYRITDWEPFEVSMVTVPADPTVGVGRTAEPSAEQAKGLENVPPAITAIIEITREERQMEPNTSRSLEEMQNEINQATTRATNEATAKERARVEEITTLSGRFTIPDVIKRRAIDEGTTVEQFRGLVLSRMPSSQPLDTPLGAIGLDSKELRQYSIMRAIRAAISKDWKGAEFERECSQQVARQVGQEARSFYLPYDLITSKRDMVGINKRDLTVGSDPGGGYLVGTQHMASSFIELLRARLVAAAAGVQVMTGLVGNIDIPKQTADATAYWLDEGGAPTEGAPTFGQVLLSPKSIGAYVDITRRLLLQSSPAADNIVMNGLVRQLALGIDKAVFHGTGADGQPTGIELVSGIGDIVGPSFAWDHAINAVAAVMNANADVPGMNWVTNPLVWAILSTREKGTAGYPVYLCGDDGKMAKFPVLISTQIAASHMFFGDFSQAIIGEWGVLDINVDDKTLSTSGGVRTVAFQSVDVAIRQAGAFALADDMT